MAVPQGEEDNRAKLYGETYPELPTSERLDALWQSLGRTKTDWCEIEAFNRLGQHSLTPSEADCLVEMAHAFSAELADDNPLKIAPMERDL